MASMWPAVAIARNEFRLLARDPAPPIFLVFVPAVVIAVLTPAFGAYAELRGAADPEGAPRALAAGAVTFSFFIVGTLGIAFFRDHAWLTWDRMRASPANSFHILLGKSVPAAATAFAQLVVLFVFGVVALGLDLPTNLLALGAIGVGLVACVTAFGLAVVGLARTLSQLNLIAYVGALALGGLGGALTPIELMPGWVQAIAPLTPAYWALEAYLDVLDRGAGLIDVLPNVAVLALFAAGFAALAAWRLRFDDVKYW